MKRHSKVKCDVNVKIKNKKPDPLHDKLHGVDLIMCKQKNKLSSVHVRNISNQQITGHVFFAKMTLQKL